MVVRDSYLEKLKNVMWDGNIKVITGLRRSGKSTLLFELFDEYLTSNDEKSENILKIELDKRKDFYKKIVIRNDIPHQDYDDKGFLYCNLIDFLLDKVDFF